MIPFVLDGSVAISFLLRDELSPAAMRALSAIQASEPQSVFVPGHFWIEITNALLVAERRRRSSRAETAVALRNAFDLPLTTDDETNAHCPGESLSLAREHGLTLYDAAYLELALRRRAGLASVDRELVRAAKALGVEVIA